MGDDQQFCLRWNNHQSTLVSVFDALLESGTLVDCTLAAEGRFLKAHKVVLSACSPYFATLLAQQYDKHPIFILKDVKFQELRAMMDYMYRGEVNISQEQLPPLLKAAESLQIKGLSDSRDENDPQELQTNEQRQQVTLPPATSSIRLPTSTGGYTLESKRMRHTAGGMGGSTSIDSQEMSGSREGSTSPTSRKRKKTRRRSVENVVVGETQEHSNSSSHSMQVNSSARIITSAAVASTSSATPTLATTSSTVTALTSNIVASTSGITVTRKTDNISNANTGNIEREMDNVDNDRNENDRRSAMAQSKKDNNKRRMQQPGESSGDGGNSSNAGNAGNGGNGGRNSDLLIEPKNEYDDGNETVEDLTLDDEELEDLEQAGPSHGGGEGSSQGYAQWQVDRSQDEIFMSTQEATGPQRDPQVIKTSSSSLFPVSNSPQQQQIQNVTLSNSSIHMEYNFEPIFSPSGSISLIQSAPSSSSAVAGAAATATVTATTAASTAVTATVIETRTRKRTVSKNETKGEDEGERFPCNVCNKSYKRKRHLQRHARDECIGIPPRFKCTMCPSRFRRKYHMVRHMNSKHGIKSQESGSYNSVSTSTVTNGTASTTGSGVIMMGPSNHDTGNSLLQLQSQSITAARLNDDDGPENLSLRNNGIEGNYVSSVIVPTVSAGAYYDDRNSRNSFNNQDNDIQNVCINDEDWKMKLSLQLISNSLLKERLINAIPFAYNHN